MSRGEAKNSDIPGHCGQERTLRTPPGPSLTARGPRNAQRDAAAHHALQLCPRYPRNLAHAHVAYEAHPHPSPNGPRRDCDHPRELVRAIESLFGNRLRHVCRRLTATRLPSGAETSLNSGSLPGSGGPAPQSRAGWYADRSSSQRLEFSQVAGCGKPPIREFDRDALLSPCRPGTILRRACGCVCNCASPLYRGECTNAHFLCTCACATYLLQ